MFYTIRMPSKTGTMVFFESLLQKNNVKQKYESIFRPVGRAPEFGRATD